MANIRASFAAGVLVLVAMDWATPAYAHNVERVRRELSAQGFEQLEFQTTKAPFKLDACRDGQRFHLHVDWYGKVTEQTPIGPCGGDAARAPEPAPPVAAPATTPSGDAPAASPQPEAAAVTPSAKATPQAQELCSRYFANVGKTLRVPCE